MSLGRAFGNVEQHADLRVTVSLDVVEDEDRACAGGKGRQGAFEIDCLVWIGRRCDAIERGLEPGKVCSDLDSETTSTPFPAALERGVECHAMQPGRKAALAAIGPQRLPDPDEDVLDQLFGHDAIGAESETEREDPFGMG